MGQHKNAAIEFLTMVAAGKVREAYDRHVAADFRHHNAWFPGDRKSLLDAMEANARENPDKVLEVQRAIEDGDSVAVFSRMQPNPGHKGVAVVHIFRFEEGRIAELWDVGQPVPDDSPNANGMF